LVNVTERTREIGVRMATGARMRDILQQFLTEALAVSGLGGLIGVAAGLGSAVVIGLLGTPVEISAGPVALPFACAFLTGLIFGYLRARKAGGLDPVGALESEWRHEHPVSPIHRARAGVRTVRLRDHESRARPRRAGGGRVERGLAGRRLAGLAHLVDE